MGVGGAHKQVTATADKKHTSEIITIYRLNTAKGTATEHTKYSTYNTSYNYPNWHEIKSHTFCVKFACMLSLSKSMH